jgi:hypothetical protein
MFTFIAPDRLFSSNWLAAIGSTFPVNHQEPANEPNSFSTSHQVATRTFPTIRAGWLSLKAREKDSVQSVETLFLSFFYFGLVNQHHRDVIFNWIDPMAFDTFQATPILF